MAATVTATVKTTITGSKVKAADHESARVTLSESIEKVLTAGNGDNQLDLWFSDRETLATEGTKSYDLTALVDPVYGDAQAFDAVKVLIIEADAANTTILTVGGGANDFDAMGGVFFLQPGDSRVLLSPLDGYAVTPDTADILLITNAAGASASFNIYIGGATAE